MPTKASNNKSAWGAKDIYDMIFSTYGNAHVNANKARAKEASKYMIPYIPEKEIMLTTGRYNTGKISTNLLDSIYNASQRTGVPLDIALGLAGRESTLGIGRGFKKGKSISGTDLYSNWQQIQTIPNNKAQMKRWNSLLGRTDLSDEDYDFKSEFLMRAQNALENTKPLNEHPIDNALRFYQSGKYNPGDKRHSQMVEEDSRILMSDPAIQKWLKTKTNKQMKCGGRRKAQLGLDIREGGIAIPIAPNMYYMNGRSHNEGGIGIGPNNKNGLEVEGGEVVKVGDKDIKVFSSVPLLRGVSPAQLVMGGANPNKVFKAQEEFKDRNRINDDGTRYQTGGQKIYTPDESIQRQIQETGRITIGGAPTIGGLRTYGYLRGLSNVRKYGQNVNNLFTKSYNFLNRKLQNLINKNKISVNTAQKYNSAYREFVGETGQNIPKTISLMQDDDIKKAGGIYIKPSKRGTFTAAAKKRGMGVQEFASKVLANKEDYSPAMVKKANFARNASHWKKEYGGNMIYTINGNVKNGLMSARPKAQLGKQRKVEGYGNTIVVGDDTFMLNEDGVYVPVGNVQINKQPKTVRGASGRRDIAYDRQGNRYQRRSDGSLIRVSPEKGNIAVSDTIRGVEVNATDVTKTRSRKQINAATKTNNTKVNPLRQKVEPNFEIGDQTVVNFLRNGNGRYNTQRTPIHSFTPAQKLGLSSYGWSAYDDPNKGYTFREDVAAVKAGQKSVDEIIGQDLSQINFDNNQSSSTPRRGETKSTSSKAAAKSTPTLQDTVNQITRDAIYRSNTPKIDLSKVTMPTFDVSQLGNKESKTYKANTPKSGRWVGQYKSTNVGDWIGLGSNLAGSIASYFMTKNAINKMPDPVKPVMAQAAKLKTRYNVEPQLTSIREAEQMNRAAVRRNTQSSNTSLAREQRLMNEARGAKNVLYGQKENIETQLINQDRLNRQSVMRDNVRAYNEYLNRLTATRQGQNQLRISNINNLISGLTGSVNNILGTIESRRATNNTLRAIAAANPNVDARLIGGFDYYIDPITKRKYNKNQQYIGTING